MEAPCTMCPIDKTIQFLGQKWMLFIMKVISDNHPIRFTEIERKIENISPKTLSKRLKDLESYNLIHKESFPELPPRVEYSLTEKGKEFQEVMSRLNSVILKWES